MRPQEPTQREIWVGRHGRVKGAGVWLAAMGKLRRSILQGVNIPCERHGMWDRERGLGRESDEKVGPKRKG